MSDRITSADRLKAKLLPHAKAMHLLQAEALYNAQVKWTCQMLDVVDEVADSLIGAMVADLICERLTGEGASEASERQHQALAEAERLMRQTAGTVLPAPTKSAPEPGDSPAAGRTG